MPCVSVNTTVFAFVRTAAVDTRRLDLQTSIHVRILAMAAVKHGRMSARYARTSHGRFHGQSAQAHPHVSLGYRCGERRERREDGHDHNHRTNAHKHNSLVPFTAYSCFAIAMQALWCMVASVPVDSVQVLWCHALEQTSRQIHDRSCLDGFCYVCAGVCGWLGRAELISGLPAPADILPARVAHNCRITPGA